MKVKRLVAIVVWTLASFWGSLLAIALGTRVLAYGYVHYGWSGPPEWTDPILAYGVFGFGTLLVTISALVLALVGALPGTRKATKEPRGFSVDHPMPPPLPNRSASDISVIPSKTG